METYGGSSSGVISPSGALDSATLAVIHQSLDAHRELLSKVNHKVRLCLGGCIQSKSTQVTYLLLADSTDILKSRVSTEGIHGT